MIIGPNLHHFGAMKGSHAPIRKTFRTQLNPMAHQIGRQITDRHVEAAPRRAQHRAGSTLTPTVEQWAQLTTNITQRINDYLHSDLGMGDNEDHPMQTTGNPLIWVLSRVRRFEGNLRQNRTPPHPTSGDLQGKSASQIQKITATYGRRAAMSTLPGKPEEEGRAAQPSRTSHSTFGQDGRRWPGAMGDSSFYWNCDTSPPTIHVTGFLSLVIRGMYTQIRRINGGRY